MNEPKDSIEIQSMLRDNQLLAQDLKELKSTIKKEIYPLMKGLDSSNLRMHRSLAIQIKKALILLEKYSDK
tara:strand:+ start:294 stop:506 length:213 start_codon:yes stop_codon:yes gene_type:complete